MSFWGRFTQIAFVPTWRPRGPGDRGLSSSGMACLLASEVRRRSAYCVSRQIEKVSLERMDLYEYQGKELFRRVGIPVSEGRLATTPGEARQAAEVLGGPVVVKAQVLTGGRGKAGGVKLAANAHEAEEHAKNIIGAGRAALAEAEFTYCSRSRVVRVGRIARLPLMYAIHGQCSTQRANLKTLKHTTHCGTLHRIRWCRADGCTTTSGCTGERKSWSGQRRRLKHTA